MTIALAENPRAVLGGNMPPLSPFEIAEKAVNDIYDETVLWLDGKAIDNQDLADGVGNLLAKIREAHNLADTTRIEEKSALDEKIKEIQARYAPLIADTKTVKGKTVLAAQACKDALAPWLARLKRDQEETARKAREVAEEAHRKAQEAIRKTEAANLAEREAAETLLAQAKKAERVAAKAEKAKPQAGGMLGKAIGLKTVWTPMMTDPAVALEWAIEAHGGEMLTYVQGLAEADVRNGKREIAGFEIVAEERAV